MNTEIFYLYRDASNYKQRELCVLEGEISQNDIEIILSKLIDGQFFIPNQVGLLNLQNRFDTVDDDDHPYHELNRDDIKLVNTKPTSDMTTKKLVENFRKVIWNLAHAERDLWEQ